MDRRLLVLAVALILTVSLSSVIAKKSGDVTELRIGVKYKPQSCEIQAHKGDKVKVHYRGTLTDGTVFDSSYERADPIDFELGAGQVIKGWDQGILGMCVGEKRKLKIPSKLGYGSQGSPPKIPAKFVAFPNIKCGACVTGRQPLFESPGPHEEFMTLLLLMAKLLTVDLYHTFKEMGIFKVVQL
ncbi:FK506-binding protein 2 isoform X1 [Amborella trichopoda]|uniref:FK506-binding protein 2 isoform X1 n=1 Tax=Amborella trichopoda TaxID=13333 RepID=UPI0005D37083|nr:FK506-binding protein 2 isoform X1 [Amborella trichopoda]|eukprot:XP_011622059.1 FK506-binding protein 2 isoform X1 [Amborella trichopoda]